MTALPENGADDVGAAELVVVGDGIVDMRLGREIDDDVTFRKVIENSFDWRARIKGNATGDSAIADLLQHLMGVIVGFDVKSNYVGTGIRVFGGWITTGRPISVRLIGPAFRVGSTCP